MSASDPMVAMCLKEAFSRTDINGDGFITKDELETILRSLADWTNDEFDALFTSFDKNGDGKLQYDEFVDWLLEGVSKVGEDGDLATDDDKEELAQNAMIFACGYSGKPMMEKIAENRLEEIVNVEVVNQMRKLQTDLLHAENEGRKKNAMESFATLQEIASAEHDRLTNKVIYSLIIFYQGSPYWELTATIKNMDPLLKQPVPQSAEALSPDEYFDYLQRQTELCRERFELFCNRVRDVVNHAPDLAQLSKDLSFTNALQQKYARKEMHTREEAFMFSKSSKKLVKLKFGPPKSKERALAKSSAAWLQEDSSLPEPKMRYALTDMHRATFEVADPLVLVLCVDIVLHLCGDNVQRVVNRMCQDKKNIRQPPNVNMNVSFGGVLLEIQFLLTKFLEVKKTLHKYYEAKRAQSSEELQRILFDWQADSNDDYSSAISDLKNIV
eukprot:gnl/MRDRNA2_/MRDRNA2_16653_c0_seq1.p1 gnl/MRDRNA2_/MRDRNA2_16653_c0~~gnl/MRDRNA2_/MRDRNA2_16653_c0_seq1.p1  ORF type:complete len:442 (-),score=111.40 gnl/MRDRNA2_/MRDRNA2_16653_c0_seq1:158-1483(-)